MAEPIPSSDELKSGTVTAGIVTLPVPLVTAVPVLSAASIKAIL